MNPPDGYKRDGQFFFELAEMTGLYRPAKVQMLMAEEMPEFASVKWPPPLPVHQH